VNSGKTRLDIPLYNLWELQLTELATAFKPVFCVMEITATLENSAQYEQLLQLSFDDLIPFVLTEWERGNRVMTVFNGLCLLCFLGMLVYISLLGDFRMVEGILYPVVGLILGSTVIIPPHELLHGLAYRLVGARRISYGGSWKRLYFYAVADESVLSARQFAIVALFPFVSITLLALLGMVFATQVWGAILLGFLLAHTLNCIGDFAMLSFFWQHRDKELYTFDRIAERSAYIYYRNT